MDQQYREHCEVLTKQLGIQHQNTQEIYEEYEIIIGKLCVLGMINTEGN